MLLKGFKRFFTVFFVFVLVGNNNKTIVKTGQNHPKTLPEPLPEKTDIVYTPVSLKGNVLSYAKRGPHSKRDPPEFLFYYNC